MNKQQEQNISIIKLPCILKISQDDIIRDGQKSQQLLQSVVCPICLMILPIPHYSCDVCDNAFCGQCLDEWWVKNHNQCVFKCENPNFKIVKRSNTYNALMEILKIKCRHCSEPVSIQQAQNHDKLCPKKSILCKNEGCGKQFMRQEIQKHQQQCQFQLLNCKYCQLLCIKMNMNTHENKQCESKQVQCSNQQCRALVKIKYIQQHQQNCLFRRQICKWCHSQLFRKDMEQHGQQFCQQRQYNCNWCSQCFKRSQHSSHQLLCNKKTIKCRLCTKDFLQSLMKDHKIECMFQNMIEMKGMQTSLIQENTKLKEKLHQLQDQMYELRKKHQEGAFDALINSRQQEIIQLKKDLLRLNNGIANIERHRTGELNQHLKKPHFSSTYCPFCIAIRKKLEEDLQPLLRQKQKVVQNIEQLQRKQSATMKSKIKIIGQQKNE